MAAPRTITSFLPTLLMQLIPNTTATHAITYTNTDIGNHVYQAKRCNELSKLDQENLDKKINGWKSYPSFIICFFILQRWARAFRDEEFYAAVNTNNGIEALNIAYKYTFLPRQRKDTRLSSVVSILIDHFLPENHHKYLFLNYKRSGSNRSYKGFVQLH